MEADADRTLPLGVDLPGTSSAAAAANSAMENARVSVYRLRRLYRECNISIALRVSKPTVSAGV